MVTCVWRRCLYKIIHYPYPKAAGPQHSQIIGTSYIRTHGMTQQPNLVDMNTFIPSTASLDLATNFVKSMLTRDMFAVAILLYTSLGSPTMILPYAIFLFLMK